MRSKFNWGQQFTPFKTTILLLYQGNALNLPTTPKSISISFWEHYQFWTKLKIKCQKAGYKFITTN